MRQIILFTITLVTFTYGVNAQTLAGGEVFTVKGKEDGSEKFQKIAHKMYLTTAYLPSKVDDIGETFYLRYNIFRDQMEFTKGSDIVYLKKEEGRKVNFPGLKTQYKILKMKGELHYFVLHNEGKNTLLSKLRMKYVEETPAQSSYHQAKPADFKRSKNELYIAFNNTNPIKVPSKKKDFYNVFGSKSTLIKDYMKKNKLSHKKIEDIRKIIEYL